MSIRSFFGSEKSKNLFFDKIKSKNAKTALIFLHGLAGSRRYWDKIYQDLSPEYTLYFVDLLGFGYSAKPHARYNIDTHINALKEFIAHEVREKSIILVGHSLGATIALNYFSNYPEDIERVVLFSLPSYKSFAEATREIQAHAKPKWFVIDAPFTKIACTIWCYYLGAVSKHIMPLFYKSLPKRVASDSLLHTYNSYISTLYSVIYNQNLPKLNNVDVKKILLIHGEHDEVVPLENIKALSKKYDLSLVVLRNEGHGIPLEAKEKACSILKSLI
ncbi:MAG: alpha/beta hydrolase [Patescibacteria group bacterium]|nr:alpha/beta hydrolase [Patescibacteria group bacterium]